MLGTSVARPLSCGSIVLLAVWPLHRAQAHAGNTDYTEHQHHDASRSAESSGRICTRSRPHTGSLARPLPMHNGRVPTARFRFHKHLALLSVPSTSPALERKTRRTKNGYTLNMVLVRNSSLPSICLILVMGLALSWPDLVHRQLHDQREHTHDQIGHREIP